MENSLLGGRGAIFVFQRCCFSVLYVVVNKRLVALAPVLYVGVSCFAPQKNLLEILGETS